jgi:tetratricopeptide (TPR) repeat protein
MPGRRTIALVSCTFLFCTWLPAHRSLHAQSAVLDLNAAGWKALEKGDPDRAAKNFAEALAIQADDPVLLLGAGASAHARGKPKEAMARLQRALDMKPGFVEASRLLGQIAYHEGDIDLATRTYENALKLAPNAVLAQELADWRKDAEVHHAFEERRYDRFRVQFEGRAEESLASQATAVLNTAFWRIGQKLGAYPSDTIVTILYTEKQFRDITRAPEWSDGLYDGRIRIPVAGAARNPALFEEVLTHELTHAMLASLSPRGIPTWLNEGLAQYFDGSDPHAARERMKAIGRSFPLADLEGSFQRMDATQAQMAYDESLLAVTVLFDRPGFGWTRLLQTLSDGQPFYRAIESFGFSYADLESPFKK